MDQLSDAETPSESEARPTPRRSEFFLIQAEEMMQRAEASPLPQVKDNYLRAARRWALLCEREREFERRGLGGSRSEEAA